LARERKVYIESHHNTLIALWGEVGWTADINGHGRPLENCGAIDIFYGDG